MAEVIDEIVKIQYAAVWPFEKPKTDLTLVHVSELKDFKSRTSRKDFNYTDLVRWKAPKALKSTLVQVLALDDTMTGLKQQVRNGVRWPHRSKGIHVAKPASTDEEAPKSQKSVRTQGKERVLKSLFDNYTNDLGSQFGALDGAQTQHEKENVLDKSVPSELEVIGKELKEERNSLDALRSSIEKQLQEGKEDLARLRQELIESARKSVEDAEKRLMENFNDAVRELHEDFKVLAESHKREMTSMKEELAKMKDAAKSGSSHARRDISSASRMSLERERRPSGNDVEEDLGRAMEKVHIGKGIYADKHLWNAAKKTTSPSNWATYILQAVYGEEAKLYRTRKPRNQEEGLKVMSETELYLFRFHYKSWLLQNPTMLDIREKETKKFGRRPRKGEQEDEASRQDRKTTNAALLRAWREREEEAADRWHEMLGQETEKQRQDRRADSLTMLLKRFNAFLGDKVQDLYRLGRTRKVSVSTDNEDNPDGRRSPGSALNSPQRERILSRSPFGRRVRSRSPLRISRSVHVSPVHNPSPSPPVSSPASPNTPPRRSRSRSCSLTPNSARFRRQLNQFQPEEVRSEDPLTPLLTSTQNSSRGDRRRTVPRKSVLLEKGSRVLVPDTQMVVPETERMEHSDSDDSDTTYFEPRKD